MRASTLNRELARGKARAIKRHQAAFVLAAQQTLERSAKTTATRFRKAATQHLAAAAPGLTSSSTMIAVYPTPEQAVALAQPNGEPAQELHVTLAFLGETPPDVAERLVTLVRELAVDFETLEGTVGGIAAFGNFFADLWKVAYAHRPDGGYGDTLWNAETSTVRWIPADWTTELEVDAVVYAFGRIPAVKRVEIAESESARPDDPAWSVVWPAERALYPSIALPDVPGLAELRHAVCGALNASGIEYAETHGWTPHLTITYTEELETPPASLLGRPLTFDRLTLARGNQPRDFVFGRSLTAAGEPPGWTPPYPDEIFDVQRFIATLHTSTDPVRRAVAETMLEKALAGAGLSFDVTNPYVGRVLSDSGARVTNIAETTRLNLMRTIRESYEQGLSIPDTAKAIEEGMHDAAPARARLIARTELGAVANGSSVAAAQIVGDAAGITYYKRWLTAAGARDPRHEDYEGLDGQTVAMNERFEVGSAMLAYPGDPDGPPEEVCNCRCAVVMSEVPGAAVGPADAGAASELPEAASEEYHGQHEAPAPEFGAPMSDLTANDELIYPANVYDKDRQVHLYGQGRDPESQAMDRKAFDVINRVKGDPDAEVTVYRGVPADVTKINPGDWVTPSKAYAEHHAVANVEDGHVISQKVHAGDLYTNGDSIQEWGWHPPENAAGADLFATPLRGIEGETPEQLAVSLLDRANELEPAVTGMLQEIVDPLGGTLGGLAFKLKSSKSLTRKLRDKALARNITPAEYAKEVSDTLRYTAIYDPENYVVNMQRTIDSLKKKGWELVSEKSINFWEASGAEYVGVNTIVRARNGFEVELQFHTAESFHNKEVLLQPLYHRARAADIAPDELAKLNAQMVALSDKVVRPTGIFDFRLPGEVPPAITEPQPAKLFKPSEVASKMPPDIEPARGDLVEAMTSLDQRLQLPADNLEVKITGNLKSEGGEPLEGKFIPAENRIEIRRLANDCYEATVHEFGHYLDTVLGDGKRYASSVSHELDEWVMLVKESPTIKGLLHTYYEQATGKDPRAPIFIDGEPYYGETIEYITAREELWARAFVQWLSRDDPRLEARVAVMRADKRFGTLGWYWPADEFAPIGDEMDRIFRERGWLR